MNHDRRKREQDLIAEMLLRIQRAIELSGSVVPDPGEDADEDARGLAGWRYLNLGQIYVNDTGNQISVTLDSEEVYGWMIESNGNRRCNYRINLVKEVLKILRKDMVIDDLAEI